MVLQNSLNTYRLGDDLLLNSKKECKCIYLNNKLFLLN